MKSCVLMDFAINLFNCFGYRENNLRKERKNSMFKSTFLLSGSWVFSPLNLSVRPTRKGWLPFMFAGVVSHAIDVTAILNTLTHLIWYCIGKPPGALLFEKWGDYLFIKFEQSISYSSAGFKPGSKQDGCLWRLPSYCSNHPATTAGFEKYFCKDALFKS